ncbi:MAG: 50S ribosomal protein L4 [Candidatus Colwellbacteria bacterium RIFCSPLOWO2_12_FULL_44_13]|uniref:Large ribosomal subunit protein uL4 n=3 Tax=Candidatus Colwelliibacteriota TaxID=1817904 RepID=A0A1G1Z6N8_9BACT|nr:MAG: 50S ribosomal protein L4 [Candidatus Colwellbacteria bacterium RIFCSPHIGHO2_12_FULL_44_17]OGY60291.1 MAG: 50S ribosomal protein L4 [Candidatus Colwellbacteria bacterium RIFCSPLOWO2_02_FULL_44_20b]OGY61524.1 MAG: 50S ribosomal protein L4 [Candidatus Colwellbacteria bacterium RIFCSPLOWO2_12_FULL_44_13]
MTADLYNQEAKKIGTVELPDKIFKRSWNADLVHFAVQAQMVNKRKPIAHTKDRSEVRGGGRKPWRQKGTGRARHGSTRSPIWIGGGVTHGPRNEKKFEVKINKKMLKGAIQTALSKRVADEEFKVVDSLIIAEAKTKNIAAILKNFFEKNPNALIIAEKNNKNIYRASKNMKNVKSISADTLNIYDLMRYKTILLEEKALETIKTRYGTV